MALAASDHLPIAENHCVVGARPIPGLGRNQASVVHEEGRRPEMEGLAMLG